MVGGAYNPTRLGPSIKLGRTANVIGVSLTQDRQDMVYCKWINSKKIFVNCEKKFRPLCGKTKCSRDGALLLTMEAVQMRWHQTSILVAPFTHSSSCPTAATGHLSAFIFLSDALIFVPSFTGTELWWFLIWENFFQRIFKLLKDFRGQRSGCVVTPPTVWLGFSKSALNKRWILQSL